MEPSSARRATAALRRCRRVDRLQPDGREDEMACKLAWALIEEIANHSNSKAN